MAFATIDVTKGISGVLPAANATYASLRPNAEPIIINGDMAVWQRSTSTVTMSDGYYNLDRFRGEEGTDGTATWSRSTSVPDNTGLAYSLQVDCTGTDSSIGSGQQTNIQQTIEAQNLQLLKWGTSDAEKVTLAFWVKSNQTGQHSVALRKLDNTAYNQPKTYTISSANTWEKKVLVFSALTLSGGAIANDNGDGLQIFWKLSAGSDYQGTADTWTATNQGATAVSGDVNFMSSTDNNFYLTGVQLEVGEYTSSTIPPFQHESLGDNLRRCQRYFQESQTWSGGVVNSVSGYVNVTFFEVMRDEPSAGTTGALNANDIDGNRDQSSGQITLHNANTHGIMCQIGNFSSMTTNNPFFSRFQNNNKITFNAEL